MYLQGILSMLLSGSQKTYPYNSLNGMLLSGSQYLLTAKEQHTTV
jgi:hypothetical protein